MSKIPLKYIGPLFDQSGYGVAARDYVCALCKAPSIDITLESVSFERHRTTYAELEDIFVPYIDRQINAKIQIVHLTPENYPQFIRPDMYNIGYTTWETNHLPADWVYLINSMHEVWVPSKWNKKVFINSGVTKPIYVIPHIVPEPDTTNSQYIDFGVDDDYYIFFSVFQWTARKNYYALLVAYLTEFKPEEKVCLALKTYRLDTSNEQQEIIISEIKEIKANLKLNSYPVIRFFGSLFPREYMKGFYEGGDCFVLPTRGEGSGIPFATAMAYGKPVIGSRYGGSLDFMNDKNSYLIDCNETPVYGMIFGKYDGSMVWGNPDIMHLRKLMRYVYENQDLAKEKGQIARKSILSQCSPEKICSKMVARIEDINAKL